jgi:hypothetical protein
MRKTALATEEEGTQTRRSGEEAGTVRGTLGEHHGEVRTDPRY